MITVEHSGDGTLVYGTERGDTEAVSALKANGFRWSRNLGAWFLPRTWGESTRVRRVKALAATLGDRVTVEYGDLGKTMSADERVAARLDRASERADRLDAQADKLAAEAAQTYGRSRELVEHIPFGQPILVGHHSERGHRRALDRSWNLMGKSVEADRAAEDAARRADGARQDAATYDNPVRVGRRLERNEAELRRLERTLHGTGHAAYGTDRPATGEHAERLTVMVAELRDRVERDRRVLAENGGTRFGRHNVKPGDQVFLRGDWAPVTKVNAKTIEVERSPGGFRLKYLWSEVTDHRPARKAETA